MESLHGLLGAPIHPPTASLPPHCRTYVVGILAPKNKVKRADYWDTAEPYHYVRFDDWDDENLLLIVGELHMHMGPDIWRADAPGSRSDACQSSCRVWHAVRYLRVDAPLPQLVLLGTAYPMQVSDSLLATARDDPLQAIDLVNSWSYSSTASKLA